MSTTSTTSTRKVAVDSPEGTAQTESLLDLAVWGIPLVTTAVVLIGVVALYFSTFHSIVSNWWRSDTYAHGFMILPISLYLLWDGRERLRGMSPRPDYRAAIALGACGMGWLACHLAGILVMEQYFAVGMIPIAVWAVLGSAVTRQLRFPLGFLLLGVPVGEALLPTMIDFAAAFGVAGLELSGIPVLRQGNILTLPNSQWSVIEECSGLRYLIASVTVGVLFAYLSFRSWRLRLLCVVASFIVPVIANGFRVYMIVTLGYVSNMRLAVGADHLFYGWFFFGIVMFLFFWLMSRFREDHAETRRELHPATEGDAVARSRFLGAGAGVIMLASLWPAWAARVESYTQPAIGSFNFPATIGAWTLAESDIGWRPHYVGADLEVVGAYSRGAEVVVVHLAYYRVQSQGAELVNSSNFFVSSNDNVWRRLSSSRAVVDLASGRLSVVETLLDARRRKLLVWSWYWIDGKTTTSPYRTKLIEMTGKLLGRPPPASGVTLYAEMGGDEEKAGRMITAFLDEALPVLEIELEALSESD